VNTDAIREALAEALGEPATELSPRLVSAVAQVAERCAQGRLAEVAAAPSLAPSDRRAFECAIAYPWAWVSRVAAQGETLLDPKYIAGANAASEHVGRGLARLGHAGADLNETCDGIIRAELRAAALIAPAARDAGAQVARSLLNGKGRR